ncbi:MAG: STAS domain-containing protein [Elusimicrobiota bacterium]|jgi:SulP family sulfate permease|nr:STAS domain-containing protein [Elusimicrobiota bacterium]
MKFRPKFYTLLRDNKEEFTRKDILREITSGFVVACIALPLSIALAIASGVTPQKGLITAVVAGFLISFFGGSRVQIAGPTAAFVVIVSGIITQYGLNGLLVATLMAGILLVIMGYLKFGAFLKYIPYPVVTGFTSGIAVVLFSTQINDFLGLGLKNIPGDFIGKWQMYFQNLNLINYDTLLIGLLALAVIIFWPKKFKFFPSYLAALLITTIAVKFFNFNAATIQTTFGNLDLSIPSPHLPKISFAMAADLIRPAFTIAFLAGIESLLSAVVADGMIGKKHRSNVELVATGLGNMASALFGGLPATGAIARTAANIDNGGRTPIAGMAHSLFLFIMMIYLMPYISLIPMASLAAILFVVAYKMSSWRSFVSLFKAPRSDIAVLLATFGLTVIKDLVVAIEFGLLLAALLFMKRMADVYNISKFGEDDILDEAHRDKDDIEFKKIAPYITVYEINGPFFFGAASMFIDALENIKATKVLILRMRNVPAMDATGYHALEQIYKRCSANNIQILLSHVQPQPLKLLKKYGFIELVGKEHLCKNIDEALKTAETLLSPKTTPQK